MPECHCVREHNPNPTTFQRHHILPKSWGGRDRSDNVVTLCGTTHDNVHALLNHYVRHDGPPPYAVQARYSRFVRELARRAWEQRPSTDRLPYTASKSD